MPYVDITNNPTPGDLGKARAVYLQNQALIDAGQAGDPREVSNALIKLGYPDSAAQFENIANSREQNARANAQSARAGAAEARAAAAQQLAKAAGAKAASGDIAGAQQLALQGGHIDLANAYTNFANSQANSVATQQTRDAYSKAAEMSSAGKFQEAATALRSVGQFTNAQQYAQMHDSALGDVKTALGNYAALYKDNPTGWNEEAIPLLKAKGYDTTGLEGTAGLNLAMASAGNDKLVMPAVKGGATGTQGATVGSAKYIESNFRAQNPDVEVPIGELIQVASRPKDKTLGVQVNPDGTKQAIAIDISRAPGGTLGTSMLIQKENKQFNADHAADIVAGRVQMKPEDMTTISRSVQGRDIKEGNLALNVLKQDTQHNYDMKEAAAQGSMHGKLEEQRANAIAPVFMHADAVLAKLEEPEASAIIGKVKSSHTFNDVRSQFTGNTKVPALWGSMKQDIEMMQNEMNRAAVPVGAVTNKAREELSALAGGIMSAPSVTVARALVREYKSIAARLLAAPGAREISRMPEVQAARDQAKASMGQAVGAAFPSTTPPQSAGIPRFNSPAEAIAAYQQGLLKPGSRYIGHDGIERPVR
jgi:hypothetical protein